MKKKLGCPEHLGGCVYEWVHFLYMVLSNFPCYERIQCPQTCYSAYIISFVCMSVVFKLKAEGSEFVLQIWLVLIGMKPPCGVLKTSPPLLKFCAIEEILGRGCLINALCSVHLGRLDFYLERVAVVKFFQSRCSIVHGEPSKGGT